MARKDYHIQYYQKNKEKIKAKQKAWAKANPQKIKDAWKKWESSRPTYQRDKLLKKYNLNEFDYLKMFKKQKGICKICLNAQTHKKLSVDHNHSTGKVRGLLCDGCNFGLGWFKDNPEILLQAIKYLNNHA